MVRKKIIAVTILAVVLFVSLSIEVPTSNGQYTQDGAACPLVSGVGITSPSNTTYTSNLLNLNITTESLFDDTIYRYVFVYSIDGQNNATIPQACLSFDLPNGDTGAFTLVRCIACTALPRLDEGSHSLTVYVTYERIGGSGNWPAVIYDSNTVCFTINEGIPPAITYLSITNRTYTQNNLVLNFTTDKATSWCGYCLDGKENVTSGNTTLPALANGPHSITVYANDSLGNMGASATIYFTVQLPHKASFPTALFAALMLATATGAGLTVLFKKKNI